jgi:hypothetical protein
MSVLAAAPTGQRRPQARDMRETAIMDLICGRPETASSERMMPPHAPEFQMASKMREAARK